MTIDTKNIPIDPIKKIRMLEEIMMSGVSGSSNEDYLYGVLRGELVTNPSYRDLLPDFVKNCRTLDSFESLISDTTIYISKRKQIIRDAFTPIFNHLESDLASPMDQSTTELFRKFDLDGIHSVWKKALERRESDPAGAITIARTLLETVIKKILHDCGSEYTNKEDLPKLYKNVAKQLNLAPDQHSHEAIKLILRGGVTMVNGLGTLRNKLSDAHATGGRNPSKPSPRHAKLAVNTAGAMAIFLVETHLLQSKD